MKFSIKTAVMSAAICCITGLYGAEPYFSFGFDASSLIPLDGWTCHGAGKTAKDVTLGSSYGSLPSLFPAGCEAYRVLSLSGANDAAYSNSTTVEGGKVEEWLVSPVIAIPEGKNALILKFDAIAFGSIRPEDYDVYVSEGGAEPADFTTHLHAGRAKGSSGAPVTETVCVPMNGFGGKDVRIAFVNRSGGTFLLGFTGISVIDYHADITSLIPEFTPREGEIAAGFDISLTTPRECRGFVARLFVEGENVREYRTDSELSAHFHETVSFTPALNLAFGQKKEYKLEVSPADESLPIYTFEGSVTCAEGFPGVCVMEEATGTWCPSCVRGAAALTKYSDDYPGQFFGIAVHEKDPMTVETYNTALKQESGISTFPSGWFNRTVLDDPQMQNHIRDFVETRLPSKVTVDAVFHYVSDGLEKFTVLYSPQLCYDTESADIRAVAVITEDHCKGTSAGWYQKNGSAGTTADKVGGKDWWPYFEFFSRKGNVIPADEMEYNHVGWGVYNDYDGFGSGISASWKAYTPQRYSITFDVPMQEAPDHAGVQQIGNTAVTVILLDGKTGQVIGADRMEASRYTEGDPTGTETHEISDFRAHRTEAGIIVKTGCEATVELFDMSGHRLAGPSVCNGSRLLRSTKESPVIIRITTGAHTRIMKLH